MTSLTSFGTWRTNEIVKKESRDHPYHLLVPEEPTRSWETNHVTTTVIDRKKRERERESIALTTSLERWLRYPISISQSLETKRCHQSSRDLFLLDYYFLPTSIVSLIWNETISKRKDHSNEQANITYIATNNVLIKEKRTFHLITLHVKPIATYIFDEFSTKKFKPPISWLTKLRKRHKQNMRKKKRRGGGAQTIAGLAGLRGHKKLRTCVRRWPGYENARNGPGSIFGIPKTNATFRVSWLLKLALRRSSPWSSSTSCLDHQPLSQSPIKTTMSLKHQHRGQRRDQHLEQQLRGCHRSQHLDPLDLRPLEQDRSPRLNWRRFKPLTPSPSTPSRTRTTWRSHASWTWRRKTKSCSRSFTPHSSSIAL